MELRSGFTRLAIAGLLALTLTGAALAGPPPSSELVESATKEAKAHHKGVLVVFGASWCPWCKRLDAVLERKEFHELIAANYVVLHLDVQETAAKKDALENPGGVKYMADVGGAKSGLPFYAFLDSQGKKVADSNGMPGGTNIGYPGTPEEIAAFERLLKRTAPKMDTEGRSRLVEYLKKNAPAPATAAGH